MSLPHLSEEFERSSCSYRRNLFERQSFYFSEPLRCLYDKSGLTSLPSVRFGGQERGVRFDQDLLKGDSFADIANLLRLFEGKETGEGYVKTDIP